MNDQKHIIVINGRRYDAKTGENLSHPAEAAEAAPVAARQSTVHKPVAPAHGTGAAKTVRQPARHVAAHAPKRAETLMRQSVKKPSASLKRRIRVQGHLYGRPAPAVEAPAVITLGHHSGPRHKAPGGRIIISHFSPDLFTTVRHVRLTTSGPPHEMPESPRPTMKPAFAAAAKAESETAARPIYKATRRKPLTTAELLEYVIQSADISANQDHSTGTGRKHHRKLLKRHAHAAVAR